MAVDMFLKLDGVVGESKDKMHLKQNDVLSWSLRFAPQEAEHDRYEKECRQSSHAQAADHGASQRGVLLGAFAKRESHREHTDNHRRGSHDNGTQTGAAGRKSSSDRVHYHQQIGEGDGRNEADAEEQERGIHVHNQTAHEDLIAGRHLLLVLSNNFIDVGDHAAQIPALRVRVDVVDRLDVEMIDNGLRLAAL